MVLVITPCRLAGTATDTAPQMSKRLPKVALGHLTEIADFAHQARESSQR
jgi:hypothetical protein